MMMGVLEVAPDGALAALLPGAHFADAYRLMVDDLEIDAMTAARRALGRAPAWVRALMVARALVVMPFGLKNGPLPHSRGGSSRVGVFPVVSSAPERVVLGLDDKHLDFRITVDLAAVQAGRRPITVTTLVRTHNLLGRVYLATILPFHRAIVPAMLAQAAQG